MTQDTTSELTAPLVDVEEAARLVAAGAVLVDVRSAGNRAENGSIPGAVVADRTDLDAEFGLDSPRRHASVVGHDTPIVVICGSVNGSGPVASALLAQGFVDVVHVEGGVPAWTEAGLPLERPA